MPLVKIITVVEIEGCTLNPTWTSPMQKITTKPPVRKGVEFYIDNMPGKTFSKTWPPGIKWTEGAKLQVEVVSSKGYYWLQPAKIQHQVPAQPQPNPPRPVVPVDLKDNLLTTTMLAQRHGIKYQALIERLVAKGYLNIGKQDDGKYAPASEEALTEKGTQTGAQFRKAGAHDVPYFMWPADLEV